MAFDPFLSAAFAGGFAVGRVVRARSVWVGRATLASVAVLVALLGASLDAVAPTALVVEVPLALAFVGLILGFTGVFVAALVRLRPPPVRSAPLAATAERVPFSVALVGALLAGYALGAIVRVPTSTAIPWALYVLLALVAFDLHLHFRGLERVWIALTAAAGGAVAAALVFSTLGGTSLAVSFATSTGFGFYSLSGPLVEARFGAALGLLAFLANFLRENLTMLLAPLVGRRSGADGVTAFGGATAMDTTLYFVTRYGDPEAGSLAIASGLVLTVAASLLVPAFVALAG